MRLLGAVLAVALSLPMAVQAATMNFAKSVTAIKDGVTETCLVQTNTAERGEICNSLGMPDGDFPTGNGFTSSGKFDALIYEFGGPFSGPITIWEVTGSGGSQDTYTGGHREYLDLTFYLMDDTTLTFDKAVANVGATRDGNSKSRWRVEFDNPALVSEFSRLMVVNNSGTPDGFDIDAIGVSAVPLPASALLLIAGLGGLAALRRRR